MKKRFWLFMLILFVIIPIIVQGAFCLTTPYRFLQANWSAGEVLTYFGTVFLGAIAAWQNERLKQANDDSQAKLERLTSEANQLSYISKVIEYELIKKSNLESCIEAFQDAASSQNIVGCMNKNDEIAGNIVLEIEKKLDESFFHINTILEKKNEPELRAYHNIIQDTNRLFKEALKMIKSDLKLGKLSGAHGERLKEIIRTINDKRLDGEKIKADFLMNYQVELDKLVYGEYGSIDNIKSIY